MFFERDFPALWRRIGCCRIQLPARIKPRFRCVEATSEHSCSCESSSTSFEEPPTRDLSLMMDFRHAVVSVPASKPWGTLHQLASGIQINLMDRFGGLPSLPLNCARVT